MATALYMIYYVYSFLIHVYIVCLLSQLTSMALLKSI